MNFFFFFVILCVCLFLRQSLFSQWCYFYVLATRYLLFLTKLL